MGNRLPPKRKLWSMLLDESGIDYPLDFVREDSRFQIWQNKYARYRGPKPVFIGGELDAVNIALDLQGTKRASGPYEGFCLLTRNVRTWAELEESNAIEVLREVPGLEALRLPESITNRKLARAELGHYAEMNRQFEQAQTVMDPITLIDAVFHAVPF